METTNTYLDAEWEPRRFEPSSPWPVDRVHLARYTLGDKDLECEILGLFAAEMPQRIEALKRAQSEKDWKFATHTLKGSGRAVGAWRVAELAQQAELLEPGAGKDAAAVAAAIQRIEEAGAEAVAYIAGLDATRDDQRHEPSAALAVCCA